MAAVRRRPPPRRTATGKRSFRPLPDDGVRVAALSECIDQVVERRHARNPAPLDDLRDSIKRGAERNRRRCPGLIRSGRPRRLAGTGTESWALRRSRFDAHAFLSKLVPANRQPPVWPDEMAGVAGGISLEVVLMLGFGLPEAACWHDFSNNLSWPQA